MSLLLRRWTLLLRRRCRWSLRRVGLRADDGLVRPLTIGQPDVVDRMLDAMVTQIDRLNSTVAIQHTQDGTVGAGSSGGTVKQYKVPGSSLEALHEDRTFGQKIGHDPCL